MVSGHVVLADRETREATQERPTETERLTDNKRQTQQQETNTTTRANNNNKSQQQQQQETTTPQQETRTPQQNGFQIIFVVKKRSTRKGLRLQAPYGTNLSTYTFRGEKKRVK